MSAGKDSRGAADDSWLDVIMCSSADDFLDRLRPSHEQWRSENLSSKWLFRGQGDDWPLLPSAWRKENSASDLKELIEKSQAFERLMTPIRRGDGNWGVSRFKVWASNFTFRKLSKADQIDRAKESMLQAAFELQLIRDFWTIANEVGHPLDDFPWAHSDFTSQFREVYMRQEQHFEHLVVAAAQHHGVPTCMLDWTMSPRTAAYFAVSGDELGDHVVVWAVRRSILGEARLREFHVPRHKLQFLHAQAGCFLWNQNADDQFALTGEWPTQDSVVKQNCHPSRPKPLMVKILLPREAADVVRERLWDERISRAHLMPTFENVSRSLLETVSWRHDSSLLTWRSQ